jgi:hypothetical protein
VKAWLMQLPTPTIALVDGAIAAPELAVQTQLSSQAMMTGQNSSTFKVGRFNIEFYKLARV